VAEKKMQEALNAEAVFVLAQLVVLWFARYHVLWYSVCQLLSYFAVAGNPDWSLVAWP